MAWLGSDLQPCELSGSSSEGLGAPTVDVDEETQLTSYFKAGVCSGLLWNP